MSMRNGPLKTEITVSPLNGQTNNRADGICEFYKLQQKISKEALRRPAEVADKCEENGTKKFEGNGELKEQKRLDALPRRPTAIQSQVHIPLATNCTNGLMSSSSGANGLVSSSSGTNGLMSTGNSTNGLMSNSNNANGLSSESNGVSGLMSSNNSTNGIIHNGTTTPSNISSTMLAHNPSNPLNQTPMLNGSPQNMYNMADNNPILSNFYN